MSCYKLSLDGVQYSNGVMTSFDSTMTEKQENSSLKTYISYSINSFYSKFIAFHSDIAINRIFSPFCILNASKILTK